MGAAAIADVLRQQRTPDQQCRRLVDLAVDAGGSDDVTALLAQYRIHGEPRCVRTHVTMVTVIAESGHDRSLADSPLAIPALERGVRHSEPDPGARPPLSFFATATTAAAVESQVMHRSTTSPASRSTELDWRFAAAPAQPGRPWPGPGLGRSL